MTGLDKITEKILLEAQKNAEKIIVDAGIEVKKILTEARAEAKAKSGEIIDRAENDAKKKNAIAKSSAESITRNRYLEIRNAILNDIISAAYLKIERLSDEEYFDLIKKLCIKNVQPGECVMYMSSYDYSRMPENFEEQINSEVFETGAVQISSETIDVENGFILKYDGFEVNCTLRSVFDESMDRLKDSLSSVLFR